MHIRIYQINIERDTNRLMFMDSDYLERRFGEVRPDSSVYDLIYDGKAGRDTLEGVYQMFNLNHPVEYTGRSLAVSDVVEVVNGGNEEPGFYFCDSIGFKEVPFAPNAVRTLADRGAISVVIVEPGKSARQAYIDSSLGGMQSIVGGLIQAVYPYDEEVCIVCNEEGKINGLPLNRELRDKDNGRYDIIAGTFIVCGCGEERFAGLTDEQLKRYTELFKYPERFIRVQNRVVSIRDPVQEAKQKDERISGR